MKNKILFIFLIALGSLFLSTPKLRAQTPKASPSPSGSSEKVVMGGYEIISTAEIGVRGLDVNGSNDKYRSDFNYKPGFRLFDSSLSMEAEEGKGKFFDSLLLTTSGWNADPTGFVRFNLEKMGLYSFDSNVRQVNHFNNLNNHSRGTKFADTQRDFGDFNLTIFPQNEKFRMRYGLSYYRSTGQAGFTTRPFSDEFPIIANVDLSSIDFRAGVDGKLAGFKLGFTYGLRRFEDNTIYTINGINAGLNTTNTSTLTSFERVYPIEGDTNYGLFTIQRTFAKKLDFTGRFIYSVIDRDFDLNERITGRDNSNNIIDLDRFFIFGDARRIQSRGDIGLTYMATDKLRISNTFSFEQYDVTGDSRLQEEVFSRTAAGAPRPTTTTNTLYYRLNGFKRYINTIEADYQFNNSFGINAGYRFTHRSVDIEGFNRPLAPATTAQTLIEEEDENSTNTLLVGTRIKPFKNWSIFADIETGESDNAFTRLSNYNFTNFRLRSNWHYKQFAFNVSGIIRNNENPSTTTPFTSGTTTLVPAGELIANVKSRIFSASVDWTPIQKFSLSTGYTYHHLTSETDIIVPLATFTQGFSQYFMRDSYAFIDVSAQPIKRVSIFASYRFDKDSGQGDRVSTAPQFIIGSYPFRLHMPEVRVAIRLTKNIDWNVGYQYYDYTESLNLDQPFPQNYTAHMPYTSVRFYFGRKER